MLASCAKSIFIGQLIDHHLAICLPLFLVWFFLPTFAFTNFNGKEPTIVSTTDLFAQEGVTVAALTKSFNDFEFCILAVPDAVVTKTNGLSFYLLVFKDYLLT